MVAEPARQEPLAPDPEQRRVALQLILLLGLVSALGDITYESARSVSGPYFLFLGASAGVIGFVSGLGEFLGYGLRLASGYLADRHRAYWPATFLGYGLLLCVPLLALAKNWWIAALLLILERVGKAVRSPARDTILSYATSQTGRGWGFALHEFLDQVGAVVGPLIFVAAFAPARSYRSGFSILWLPAVLTMVALTMARLRVPEPVRLESGSKRRADEGSGLPRVFRFYAAFTFFSVAGFASFQVISYHWTATSVVSPAEVPILYAVAMGVDAFAALAIGKAYDRAGLTALAAVPALTLAIPFLAFGQRHALAIASALLWGVVMAAHETIMRAAIADLTAAARRALAYGIFNTLYGAGWFAGSWALGALYGKSVAWASAFIVALELIAVAMFLLVRREQRPSAGR